MDFDLDKHIDAIADVERGVDNRFQEVIEAPMYTTEADLLRGNATSSIENIMSEFGFEYIPQSNNQVELLSFISSDSSYEELLRIKTSVDFIDYKLSSESYRGFVDSIKDHLDTRDSGLDGVYGIVGMVNNLGGYHELDSIKSQIISSFDNDFDRTIDLYEDHIGNKISKGLVSGDLGLDESIELEDKLNELKSIRSSMNFDRLKELVNDEGGVLNIIEVSAYNKLIVNEHFDNNRSIDSKNNIEESLTAKDIFEIIELGDHKQEDRELEMRFGAQQAYSADIDMKKMSYIMGDITADELFEKLTDTSHSKKMAEIINYGGIQGVVMDYNLTKDVFIDFMKDNPELIESMNNLGEGYSEANLQHNIGESGPYVDINFGEMKDVDLDKLIVGLIQVDPTIKNTIIVDGKEMKAFFSSEDAKTLNEGNYIRNYRTNEHLSEIDYSQSPSGAKLISDYPTFDYSESIKEIDKKSDYGMETMEGNKTKYDKSKNVYKGSGGFKT